MSSPADQAIHSERTELRPQSLPVQADFPMPDVLCITCQALFDDTSSWHDVKSGCFFTWESSYTQFCRPFRTMHDIRAHAAEGCHLCIILEHDIETEGPSKSTRLPIENEWAKDPGGVGIPLQDEAGPIDDNIELLVSCLREHSDGPRFCYRVLLYARSTDPKYLFQLTHEFLSSMCPNQSLIRFE